MLCGVEADARTEVEEICSFEGRLAGTDAERRAANRIAAELGAGGRRCEIEPTTVQPQWAVVHMLHCLIAAVASMIAGLQPAIAFALVLFAATSAYLDLSARHYLIRRLLFRRASQNVHARAASGADADAPRVILCANVDSPRTGAAYGPAVTRLRNSAARRFPVVSSPTRLWFWSIALLLPPIGARMAGIDADWLAVLQLPPTLILIVAAFLLGEIALSPASPGANANASGVAAALTAAHRLDADPPESLAVDVVVLGGGETTMQGMRAFVRSHRKELERRSTWFLSLESVGHGDPRWLISQGLAISLPMDPGLRGLAEAISLAADEDGHAASPIRDGSISAGWVARAYGYRALAITSREDDEAVPAGHHTPQDTPGAVEPEAIERAAVLAEQLVRLLDRDLTRRSATPRPLQTASG